MKKLRDLDSLKFSKQENLIIDNLLKEFYSNNKRMFEPSKKFWDVVKMYMDKYVNSNGNLQTSISYFVERDTSFLFNNKDNTKNVYHGAEVIYNDAVWDVFSKKNYPTLNIKQLKDYINRVGSTAFLRYEEGVKMVDLIEKNSDIITNILKMDIQKRIGNNFKGIYAYCGLDIDLPYQLGGDWLLIEPDYQYKDYDQRIKNEIRFGKKGLDSGRLKISHSNILEGKNISDDVNNYDPDILIMKCPTPGAEEKDLLDFYKKLIKKDTLLLSDSEIKMGNFELIENIVGKTNLKKLKSERPIFFAGSLRYPVREFQMYLMKK
jgi:hypothetical protein